MNIWAIFAIIYGIIGLGTTVYVLCFCECETEEKATVALVGGLLGFYVVLWWVFLPIALINSNRNKVNKLR
jgi:hypothetical protein